MRREGEALAKRRGRAAEVDEARAAVETLVTWYRDLLAATLGADDALVHSDHRGRSRKRLQTVAKHLPRVASRRPATRAERWS